MAIGVVLSGPYRHCGKWRRARGAESTRRDGRREGGDDCSAVGLDKNTVRYEILSSLEMRAWSVQLGSRDVSAGRPEVPVPQRSQDPTTTEWINKDVRIGVTQRNSQTSIAVSRLISSSARERAAGVNNGATPMRHAQGPRHSA